MNTSLSHRPGRFLDYLFVLRPVLLIPTWTFVLLGYWWGQQGPATVKLAPQPWPSPDILLALLLYSTLMGGIYVLNQIYDLETDRVNRKVFFLSEGLIPVPAAVVETGVLLAASLVLSLQFSRPFRTLVLASLVLSLLYCTPPIKLKGRPFLDLVANAVGYGCLALWAGWSVNAALSYRALLHSLPYAFAVGGVFSLTTVPDIPGDRAAGEFTSGVLLGVRGAAILAVVLIASSLTLSTWLRDPICALAALVPLPFYGWAAIRGDIRSCRRANWVGGLALVVLAGILFPWFLALVGCTYLALRIYYRRRFGMRYPF